MDTPFRGPGGYRSEEQEFSPFHHRPPPPPPPEDEVGEGRFGGRRGDYDEGGYPHGGERRYGRGGEDEGDDRFGRGDGERRYGRGGGDEGDDRFGRGDDKEVFDSKRGGSRFGSGDDDEGFGRRRGEEGRFGGGDNEDGYPPKPPPRFPGQGFQGQPEYRHEGYEHDAYSAADDEFPLQKSPPPRFTDSESHYSKQPSTEYEHVEPHHTKEEPVVDASLSNQIETLSLDLPQGRLVRIFCKADAGYNLAVEHNSLQMQESNSENEAQQWIKDASHGMRVKDSLGFPAFSLVNKRTKKLLKHAGEKGQQVLLTDYQAGLKDDSVLWTESQDFGEGFKTVRCASDAKLNLTVFEGNKRVRNGSALVLDTWTKGDHQYWKIFPL